MTPLAYALAAIGGTVCLLAVAFLGGVLFEHWQIGREIDDERNN